MSILERHVKQIMEHFDTVQIFVTKHNGHDQSTAVEHFGNGNWYARYGQIELWLQNQTPIVEKDSQQQEDYT